MRLRNRASVLVCVGGALIASTGVAQVEPGAGPAASRLPDFRRIVQESKDKVFPAVVYIKCVRETNDAGKKASQEVTGSGVIVSEGGEVLTNWHVVDKATSIRCLLSDGRHADADLVGSDKDCDLAMIQLKFDDKTPLPFATIGDSTKLQEGDFVMAMGAPWGLNRSVSIGIVSCTTRYLDQISEYSLWIQTDAPINPGNSGGPLVNTDGEVVGLNARGMSGWAEGMGFAIPAETIKVLMPQLREHGRMEWSWTGLQLQPLRDFNRDVYFDDTEGVIVSETDPESPARRAGFQARDRILKVNGEAVTAMTQETLPAVQRRLGLLDKGAEAVFEVEREGKAVALKLTPREKGKVEGDELALARFDFTVKTINQFDNPDLHFHRNEGVFVYALKYPGNASNSGLTRNDIILKVDGKEVKTIDDVKAVHAECVAGVEKKHRVVVVVLRSGLMRQIVVDFLRDYEKQ